MAVVSVADQRQRPALRVKIALGHRIAPGLQRLVTHQTVFGGKDIQFPPPVNLAIESAI